MREDHKKLFMERHYARRGRAAVHPTRGLSFVLDPQSAKTIQTLGHRERRSSMVTNALPWQQNWRKSRHIHLSSKANIRWRIGRRCSKMDTWRQSGRRETGLGGRGQEGGHRLSKWPSGGKNRRGCIAEWRSVRLRFLIFLLLTFHFLFAGLKASLFAVSHSS